MLVYNYGVGGMQMTGRIEQYMAADVLQTQLDTMQQAAEPILVAGCLLV